MRIERVECFLELYEADWGRSKSAAWFRWRFAANPYGNGSEMIAGLETAREETHAVAATDIVDVKPMARGAASDAARSALLGDAVRDNRDVDVLCVAGSSLPDGVLSPGHSSATTRSPRSAVSERTV